MPQDRAVATVERAAARRGELDLLRALVVVGLVFFHSAVIFGAGEFPVKAETEHLVATVFLAFGATWGMPCCSPSPGWASGTRCGRAARPGSRGNGCGGSVPLAVGLLTLVPLQIWLGCDAPGTPPPAPGTTGGSGTCGPR